MDEPNEATPLVEVRVLDDPEVIAEPPMPRRQRFGGLLLAIGGLAAAAGTVAPLLSSAGTGPGGGAIRFDMTAWGVYFSPAQPAMVGSTPQWGFAIAAAVVLMFACGGSLAVTTRFAHGARTIGLIGFGVLIGGTWQLGTYLRDMLDASGNRSLIVIGPGVSALVLACLLGLAGVVVLNVPGRKRPHPEQRPQEPPTIPIEIAVVRLPDAED